MGGTEMFKGKKYGGGDAERRRREDRGAEGAVADGHQRRWSDSQ